MTKRPEQKSSQLIQELTANLPPVSIAGPAIAWTAAWALAANLVVLAPLGLALGIRPGLGSDLLAPLFSFKLLLLFAVGLLCIYLAFRLSLPGRPALPRVLEGAPIGLGLVFFSTLAIEALSLGMPGAAFEGTDLVGLKCLASVLCLSIAPSLISLFLLRRLAPLRPGRVAWLLGAASGSLGAWGVGLHCASLQPVHWALWHGLPIFIVAGLATVLAARALRW